MPMPYNQLPEVTVTQIPFKEAGDNPIRPDLGQEEINESFSGVLSILRDEADSAYLLTWQGEVRVPRGAVIGSYVVAWTQHGMVQTEDGKHIGIYDRIKDIEGPNRQNEMLVLAFPQPPEEKSDSWTPIKGITDWRIGGPADRPYDNPDQARADLLSLCDVVDDSAFPESKPVTPSKEVDPSPNN